MKNALYLSVFVISTCGLIYELLAGALASYLLGETVTHFSIIIGIYLFSMGIGSFLSRYLEKDLINRFVDIEIVIGLLGGFSSAFLFVSFSFTGHFRLVLFLLIMLIGILVGLEIPLLLRIMKKHLNFKELVSAILTLDYIGALLASVLFPLVLVPKLGIVRTAFFSGILNSAVALWTTWILPVPEYKANALRAKALVVIMLLTGGFAYSDWITDYAEENLYSDEIILSRNTPFQRIVLTRWKDELRLFLNGHLQFSTRDEYRYHEVLVHPALSQHPNPRKVLVLGGGDGMAVREVLKYPSIEKIRLVDLDKSMTDIFSNNTLVSKINEGSLKSPKTEIINEDAFKYLEKDTEVYDLVFIDFPDPSNYSIGKLYTTAFYRLLKRRMNASSIAVIQSTSPLFARKSFWCINKTIRDSGFQTYPMHVYVPSFGEWGFVMAKFNQTQGKWKLPNNLRFLNEGEIPSLFNFSKDMGELQTEVNRLNNQVLVRYYDEEWKQVTPF